MSTKIGMMIISNKSQVSQPIQIPLSSNRMVMPINSNNLRVIENNNNNIINNPNYRALSMNLAQINKTKGCGCGGGK